jgi:hypothetical protein
VAGAVWEVRVAGGLCSDQRVPLEEVRRPQLEGTTHRRHHRKVLLVWEVVHAQSVPQHNVLLLYPPVPPAPGGQVVVSRALLSVQPGRPLLRLVVRRHPHLLLGVAGAALRVVIVGEQRGRSRTRRDKPVADLIADAGLLAGVDKQQVRRTTTTVDVHLAVRLRLRHLSAHRPIAPPWSVGTTRGGVSGVAHGGDRVLDEGVLGAIDVEVQVVRDEVVVVDADGVRGEQGAVRVLLDLVDMGVGRGLHL